MSTKRTYGWKRQAPDARDVNMTFSPRRLATLPTSVSLAPSMSQPDNQGQLGSCGPNTTDEHLKFDFKVEGQTVRNTSRLFTYYNTRALMGSVGQDSGVDKLDDAEGQAAQFGFCDETLWPYDDTPADPNTNTFPPNAPAGQKPPAHAYAAALANKITSYAAVNTDLQSMKACLASGHPFIFGFTCFQEIESDAVAQTGDIPDPQPGEQPIGGHDILCWGYDDATQRFKVTNHWSGWGRVIDGIPGCGTISYAYASNPQYAGDFWVINAVPGDVPVPPNPPTPNPPNPPGPPTPPSPQPIAGVGLTLTAPLQAGSYEVSPEGAAALVAETIGSVKKLEKLFTG